ncbi:UTP--glucose-1-phosphate uridylyltransferase [Sulfurimonas diazotrophicus]|uniref:UTP--glucose-1-phosphate uridylyltransferase n=1 Tax=Sulfurimonas diazotrophicus TaxID=3131939 RepID=A0ABZ3H8G9_9BACT
MSEIRYDKLHDVHVLIAPERLHRPDCIPKRVKAFHHVAKCPFCEGNESLTPPEIFALRDEGSFANEPGWKTRVVPNLYKAVQIETPHRHHYGLFEYHDGFGAHEVIIDTPEHRTSMTQWSEQEVVDWLLTLGARVADLRRDIRIGYISLFKNEGSDAGATQPHSHTQLIGLPILPEAQRAYYERNAHYFREHGTPLVAAIISHERQAGERIIAEQGGYTAYCPFASAYPFEVIIASEKRRGQIDTLGPKDFEPLAPLLLDVLAKLERQLGCLAFNVEIATPPFHVPEGMAPYATTDDMFRFTLRIQPRLYRHGGFELSTQVMINPVAPETAARLLRGEPDA